MQDIVFSFDTTGSMASCIAQVRSQIVVTTTSLFARIPNLRIGIIAHGDYCDGRRCIEILDLTADGQKILKFINNNRSTGGGDADECYELALNKARSMNWRSGASKALVLIGDCNPHEPGYMDSWITNRPIKLDWRKEAQALRDMAITLYPIQALDHLRGSETFYDKLALHNPIGKLTLPQFADITDILCGICYTQASPEQLQGYTREYQSRPESQQSPHVLRTLAQLAGVGVESSAPLSKRSTQIGSKYQLVHIDRDIPIAQLVESLGLIFEPGKGFYELTKSVLIQEYKEVVAMNKKTRAILTGIPARKALKIPVNSGDVQFKPDRNCTHVGFVQSTSYNRKLIAGTRFLYEMAE